MRDDYFEYGGYTFQPYAKYTAPISVFDEFINYDTIEFTDTKFDSKEFYKKSPVQNCDVFYCVDNCKLYIPQNTRLCEYDEPTVAQYCKARMVNDYEIIHSFYVGEKEVIVGENKNAEYRYFCGYYETNEIFSQAVNCQLSNDYLEIMQIYCDRTKEQVELCKAKEIEGAKPITADMCNDAIDGNMNLNKKVVVIKPDVLRREFQNEHHQLMYVTGGNGAMPNSRGTKVYGYILGNKNKSETYFRRYDIMGIMDKDKLPEWASKSLAKIERENRREER